MCSSDLDGGKYASLDLAASAAGASVEDATLTASVVEQVETMAKYAGYIDRQQEEVGRVAHFERLRLPADLDYMAVSALSFEARQTLTRQRPETLGQASRMPGITPATVSLLLVHLKKSRGRSFLANSGSTVE